MSPSARTSALVVIPISVEREAKGRMFVKLDFGSRKRRGGYETSKHLGTYDILNRSIGAGFSRSTSFPLLGLSSPIVARKVG